MTRLLRATHAPWAWRRALMVAAMTLVMLALPVPAARVYADGPLSQPEGQVYFEDETNEIDEGPSVQAINSGVAYIADCQAGQAPPACGGPAARWSAANRPVVMCTYEAGRLSWLAAEQFRQVVANSAAVWNSVEAGIGITYTGDCPSGTTWTNNNLRNEIGFDDSRGAVTGSAAAVTRSSTSWSPPTNPTIRLIVEADTIIGAQFPNLPSCFNTTVLHEMGHVLGFGHSADLADLMYPSFDPNNPASCKQGPSAPERAALQSLYGVNRAPTVIGGDVQATPGNAVTLNANATDPEGDTVSYQWVQTGGTGVALSSATAASPSFTSPAGGTLQFQVTATDSFGHATKATVSVTVASMVPTAPTVTATPSSTTSNSQTAGGATISGTLPTSGFGLFVFSGGTELQLVAASRCATSAATFWATDNGNFVVYVPGSTVSAVNAAWSAKFPSGIPAGTALLGRCRS